MPIEIRGKKHYWTLEFCHKARISRSTLLRWLRDGVIQEPIKDRRGWRIFSDEDLRIIRAEIEKTHPNDDR